MDARARAMALMLGDWLGTHEERVQQVAAAIREAENEALERAAMECDACSGTAAEPARTWLKRAAARIRSLKETP